MPAALSFASEANYPALRRPLQIGFLCPHNPHDRSAFSGTAYHAARALGNRPDVFLRILGHHRPYHRIERFFRRGHKERDIRTLCFEGLDAIVGLVASELIEHLPPDAPPVLHVTDATPAFLRTAYQQVLPPAIDARERRVVEKAALSVYSSHEMAARAPRDLGLSDAMRRAAVPFGLNAPSLPRHRPCKPPLKPLELVFVGLDWTRKGGDMAVKVLDRLRATGHETRLTVVGSCPETVRHHPGIEAAGFLDQNRSAHRDRLAEIYTRAHAMLLPTRADCTPMVVAEAFAFGVPVLATDTGGMATLVTRGTGRLLPKQATVQDWVEAVQLLVGNPTRHALAADAAFDRVSQRLNWNAWAEDILLLARNATAQRACRAA